MRQLSFFVVASTLVFAACSHSAKKADTPESPTKASVQKSATSKAEVAASTGGDKLTCAVKGDERVLEVRGKGPGCEFAYTKAGKEGIVASSVHGKKYCENALDKLRDKLKGAGYDCK